MRKLLHKLGQLNLVIIITVLSVLLSVGMTIIASLFFSTQSEIETSNRIIIAIIFPLIMAPITTWSLTELVLKIDNLEEKMRSLATFDGLTGILSRSAFFHDSSNLIEFSHRAQIPFSVLALDLDDFKLTNDKYGSSAGDEVLRNFSTITKTILRSSDLVGRIGEEKFAIMLPNTSEEKAVEISERLHIAIRKSIVECDGVAIKYSVSTGLVSVLSKEKEIINNVLKLADKALYQAKNNGRDCTVIFKANNVF